MERMPAFENARNKILGDVYELFGRIKPVARITTKPTNFKWCLEVLQSLRSLIAEDLNQIQHEALLLQAAEHIEGTLSFKGVEWYWNPRQTGNKEEPDLEGKIGSETVVSAEVTTAEKPVGATDKRIKYTLEKLSKMPGRKFYVVRTIDMEKRARTKADNLGLKIGVIIPR